MLVAGRRTWNSAPAPARGRGQRHVAPGGQREAARQRQAEPGAAVAVDARDAAGLEDVLARIGPDAGPVVGDAEHDRARRARRR